MQNKITVSSAVVGTMLSLAIALPAFAMDATGSMMVQSNLHVGSRGTEVSTLQTFLVSKGFLVLPPGASTGYFGQLTRSAVMQYQASVGVSRDT